MNNILISSEFVNTCQEILIIFLLTLHPVPVESVPAHTLPTIYQAIYVLSFEVSTLCNIFTYYVKFEQDS